MKTILLELDELDYDAVQKAMAIRQRWVRPDGGGNVAGQVVAEICRGWMEFLDMSAPKEDDGE